MIKDKRRLCFFRKNAQKVNVVLLALATLGNVTLITFICVALPKAGNIN
jgi:hypothetical protein